MGDESSKEVATQNTEVAKNQPQSIKEYFQKENVKAKFAELLDKRATAFITSLMAVVQNNNYLKKAKPESVYMSAMVAATLDLPINPNLGFAYIIPYGEEAQFQLGYKGFIQLSLRSGQFKTISTCPVYEGQLITENPLTGYIFDWTKKTNDVVIGYAAYFSLINGFEKTSYMTKAQIEAHGKRFSKTFTKADGIWKKDFDAMAQKTVLKLLLSKYAPLSVEMQKAIIADQAVIKDAETMDVEYVDEGKERDEISHEDLTALFESKIEVIPKDKIKDYKRILEGKETNSYLKMRDEIKDL